MMRMDILLDCFDDIMYIVNNEGYSLLNMPRGLTYNKNLILANKPYQVNYEDSRGKLSLKTLNSFLDFMLDTAINQFEYMSNIIRIDSI